jgi:hypothetical protein
MYGRLHAIAWLALAGPVLSAPLQFSADIALRVGTTSAPDHSILLDDGTDLIGFIVPSSLPDGVNLDALDIRNDDTVLFSLDKACLVGGVYAEPGDVVACRYASCALAFDASTLALPPLIDVDAVATRNGRLVVSFTRGVRYTPVGYISARDAIEFNGGNVSAIVFDGDNNGVPANANLDALHVLPNGRLLLSFDRTLSLGSVTAFDHDVVEFDPANSQFNVARALGSGNPAWWPADLDAISGAAVADRLFRDGFE